MRVSHGKNLTYDEPTASLPTCTPRSFCTVCSYCSAQYAISRTAGRSSSPSLVKCAPPRPRLSIGNPADFSMASIARLMPD